MMSERKPTQEESDDEAYWRRERMPFTEAVPEEQDAKQRKQS